MMNRGAEKSRVRGKSRRGVTLIEVLLMMSLALGLMAVALGMMKKSNALTAQTGTSIELQVGVRNLLENMVRDMGACHQVLTPGTDVDKPTLVLIKYASDEVQSRFDKNTDKAFPFVSSAAGTTTQKMDALRVTYTWIKKDRIVTRKEESGEFISASETNTPAILSQFSFPQPKTESDRQMATSVETLAISYIGYDPQTGELKKVGPGGLGFEKTACIAVHINAQFDEGLYSAEPGPNGRVMPKIEIFTKIWSVKRRSDEVYKEYFSSTDEDLRW